MVYRADRDSHTSTKSRGGGVLIAVMKSLSSYQLQLQSNREELWVKVKSDRLNFILCAVYIPPSSHPSVYSDHLNQTEVLMQEYDQSVFCLVGDYNLPNVHWNLNVDNNMLSPLVVHNNLVDHEFCDSLNYLNLNQFNHVCNNNSSILDLVLSNDPNVKVIRTDPLSKVDPFHPPLEIAIHNVKLQTLNFNPQVIYDFNKAPYNQINQTLSFIDWQFIDIEDLDLSVEMFYSCLFQVIDFFVPKKKLYYSTFPSWVSKQTQALISRKKSAHKKYKSSGLHDDYLLFSNLRQIVGDHLERDKRQFITNSENNIIRNPKSFWNYISSTRKEHGIPRCVSLNGKCAADGAEVCSFFANFFQSRYSCNISPNSNIPTAVHPQLSKEKETLSLPTITYTDICGSLQLLKTDHSRGPDNIPSIFLRGCSNNFLKPLHIIFNNCIKFGKFPHQWKLSNIIPIHKSASKSEVSNYRPISINNNFAKVFDRILAQILTAHVNDFIVEEQHGFIKGRSTETNLFVFASYVNRCIEAGFSVDCIYTDMKKAFDRVPIHVLLVKLKSLYRISDPLLSCLRCFLLNRSQQVTVNGYVSLPFTASSGVGQGTHLGPVLFLLFINDLKLVLQHSKFLLFADDCKIYKCIKGGDDFAGLQHDLDAFVEWCSMNGLDLNVGKCKHVKFTRKMDPLISIYYINNTVVESIPSVKDLGVHFDSKLSFNVHINHILCRANKLLGFINRATKPFSNLRSMHLLFVTLVRPILEYCCIIWAPSYHVHISRLESIQKKFVRRLCFKFDLDYYGSDYNNLLQYFSLQLLKSRRDYADIMFLFKVLNNTVNCISIRDQISFFVPSRPLRHHPFLFVEYHRTNYGLHSSLVRISRLINSLNLDQDSFDRGIISFRSLLRRLLYT